MKRFFCIGLMALSIGVAANAQTVISNNYDSPITSSISSNTESDEDEQSQGGMDFQYHGVEHGWGLSLDYVFKYFVLGFNYNWGETNDYIKTNNGMEYYVGGNYRYHIVKQFYVEGRMLAGWYNWNTKIKTGKSSSDEVNTNKAFIGINPRIGLDFDGWGISAGYRWDYVDFKFDKDHKFDRFTIGISIGI